MNKIFEKFKTINWKSKKSIIAYAIIFAILIGGTGTGLAVNYFNNNSDIVKTDVKDKTTSKSADDKKEDKKSDNKNDTDKKAESSKPTEKKEEDKKDTNETSKTDNKEEDKKTNTQVNNTNNSNNSNSNNNTSNNGNNTTPTPPTNNGGGNSGNNSTPTTQPPAHQHSWVEVYETINHEEQGHYEQVPIYETKAINVCNQCKIDITGNEYAHNDEHLLNGEQGGWHSEYIQTIVGYDDVWVVDVPAWPEKVLKGYACSCGATK